MNGFVSYASTRYNHAAHYICHNGYKLVGSLTRICTGSGQWSGAQPSCLSKYYNYVGMMVLA